MDPYVSWGCVIAIGIGLWWYYYQRHQVNRAKPMNSVPLSRKVNVDAASKRDERKSKARKERPQTTQSPNLSNQSLTASKTVSGSVNERPVKSEDAEGLSNQEFARQLSNVKAGTKLTRPTQDNPGKTTRRAHKQAETLVTKESTGPSSSQDISTNSSTTGADADDDLSPAASPSLAAMSNGRSVMTSGDVSDMLEAPSAGPSVLRLTGAIEPIRTKQTQPRPFEVQETKKQRSARRKNEARKAEREEAEKERRVLLEKQLRTAREAENRPPRNGTARQAPRDTDRSPWKPQSDKMVEPGVSATDVGHNTSAPQLAPDNHKNPMLLDTFDTRNSDKKGLNPVEARQEHRVDAAGPALPSSNGPASGELNGYAKSGESTQKNAVQDANQVKQSWADDLPSEDEQLRMISAMNGDDGWNTVGKRIKKKTPKSRSTGDTTSNESSDIGGAHVQGPNKPSAMASFQEKEKSDTEIREGLKMGAASYKSHPLDSDWAVV